MSFYAVHDACTQDFSVVFVFLKWREAENKNISTLTDYIQGFLGWWIRKIYVR